MSPFDETTNESSSGALPCMCSRSTTSFSDDRRDPLICKRAGIDEVSELASVGVCCRTNDELGARRRGLLRQLPDLDDGERVGQPWSQRPDLL